MITMATMKDLDNMRTLEDVRSDFPILSRKLIKGGKEVPLVYLDNAATTQKPLAVIRGLEKYYRTTNANVHRALHTLGEEATQAFEESRKKVAAFINASTPDEIIFTRGTTESINLVASTWGRANLKAGDVVLLTEMEHHSNLIPWQMLKESLGIELMFIPFNEKGELDIQWFFLNWNPRIKLVSLAHVSNVFGTVNNVEDVIRFTHSQGALVLMDSAQGIPHLPVDVTYLDVDFLAFSGHKMCGPMGIGVLYAKGVHLDKMPPWMGGGEMIHAVWLDRHTVTRGPHKFEAGTPDVAGAIGLGLAIDYLSAIGMVNIAAYEKQLTRYALERLEEVPGLTLYGRADERSGVISFNLENLHSHDLTQFMDMKGIALRAGHHCAQPVMRKLGVPSTTRASFYFYNTREEIDFLVETLKEVKEFFHGTF